MPQNILIVDDEQQIRAVLAAYLRNDGFGVQEAATGADCLAALASDDGIALVLLDLGLPDLGGLDVLARLRSNADVPVIVVSARTEEPDRLMGLTAGADDYITKPFSPREVVARVRTVLRRASRAEALPELDPVLRFDDLTIDPRTREVCVQGRPVDLSALDFDLLVALASEPGRVFSRPQLLERVWGYDFYGDERVVDVHIRSMRAALGDDAVHPRYLGTVRGVGYRFLPGQS